MVYQSCITCKRFYPVDELNFYAVLPGKKWGAKYAAVCDFCDEIAQEIEAGFIDVSTKTRGQNVAV